MLITRDHEFQFQNNIVRVGGNCILYNIPFFEILLKHNINDIRKTYNSGYVDVGDFNYTTSDPDAFNQTWYPLWRSLKGFPEIEPVIITSNFDDDKRVQVVKPTKQDPCKFENTKSIIIRYQAQDGRQSSSSFSNKWNELEIPFDYDEYKDTLDIGKEGLSFTYQQDIMKETGEVIQEGREQYNLGIASPHGLISKQFNQTKYIQPEPNQDALMPISGKDGPLKETIMVSRYFIADERIYRDYYVGNWKCVIAGLRPSIKYKVQVIHVSQNNAQTIYNTVTVQTLSQVPTNPDYINNVDFQFAAETSDSTKPGYSIPGHNEGEKKITFTLSEDGISTNETFRTCLKNAINKLNSMFSNFLFYIPMNTGAGNTSDESASAYFIDKNLGDVPYSTVEDFQQYNQDHELNFKVRPEYGTNRDDIPGDRNVITVGVIGGTQKGYDVNYNEYIESNIISEIVQSVGYRIMRYDGEYRDLNVLSSGSQSEEDLNSYYYENYNIMKYCEFASGYPKSIWTWLDRYNYPLVSSNKFNIVECYYIMYGLYISRILMGRRYIANTSYSSEAKKIQPDVPISNALSLNLNDLKITGTPNLNLSYYTNIDPNYFYPGFNQNDIENSSPYYKSSLSNVDRDYDEICV